MKNKIVGYLIIILGLVIGLVIYMFNYALSSIVSSSCTHGTTCPMWGTLSLETNVSLLLMAVIIGIGVYLVFFGEEKQVIAVKKGIKRKPKHLTKEEKIIFDKISEEEGSIFQSDLVEKTGFSKVKVSRILDKLEGMGIIERKRRGMTNFVVFKD